MSIEDKRIGRLIEKDIHRFSSLDVSNAEVIVFHGIGHLGGVIRPATGLYNLNMKEEMRIVIESTRKIPGLKDLIVDADIEIEPLR